MSVFTEEESDEEYHGIGRDVWAEHEAKKRDPHYFEKKNKMELMRSNPSYTIDAERKRIQKKLDDEKRIKDYRTQFPNVVKTIRIIGDQSYGILFTGEADLLAYQVRNSMKLNNLKQSQGMRIFSDGTRITVQSFFGQDIITIDVSQSTGDEEPTSKIAQKQCTITLINIPIKIQPMKEPGKIGAGEVQGTDYIKTYYQFDVGQCPDCQDIKMDFLFKYITPKEGRHYEAEIDNHCIYSLKPPCWGAVVSHGNDALGDYFIWKAHTEYGIYSRTGFGILDLKASVSDAGGEVICETDKKVEVDCCEKDSLLRKVEIWWEPQGALIKMESPVSLSDLIWYSSQGGLLYAIPETKGGCLPFVWGVVGQGSITPMDEFGTTAHYNPPANLDCNSATEIHLTDRCGTLYVANAPPCCDSPPAMNITYTALVMSCNQSQNLGVTGGCAPYSWSLTGGGGTLTPWGTYNLFATYLSPATNPGCVSNPTITVTDCCGNTANLQLAVNCYAGGSALHNDVNNQSGWHWDAGNQYCSWTGSGICDNYDCAGTILNENHYPIAALMMRDGDQGGCMNHISSSLECDAYGAMGPETRCVDGGQFCSGPWGLSDTRTQAMKDAGCCPLNPLTGLPY